MATIFDRLLLAKTETTKNTDAVPAPETDAIRVRSFKVKKNTTAIERKVVKQTMGALGHLIGKETVTIEIVAELRGSGAAGTAPEIAPLLLACRMSETVSAGVSVAYKPATLTEKSATIYAYTDGLLWKLIGAVGTAKIDSSMDAVTIVTFTMHAAYVVPAETAVPAGAAFDATQPIVMTSATVVNDGSAIKVGKFGLDMGNDVQNHYVTGENSFVVANRNPSLSYSKDSVNTAAEWAALSAGTNTTFSAALGATAGNICTITAPVMRRKDVAYSERAERDLNELSYGLFESSSDDQFAITFS